MILTASSTESSSIWTNQLATKSFNLEHNTAALNLHTHAETVSAINYQTLTNNISKLTQKRERKEEINPFNSYDTNPFAAPNVNLLESIAKRHFLSLTR